MGGVVLCGNTKRVPKHTARSMPSSTYRPSASPVFQISNKLPDMIAYAIGGIWT